MFKSYRGNTVYEFVKLVIYTSLCHVCGLLTSFLINELNFFFTFLYR